MIDVLMSGDEPVRIKLSPRSDGTIPDAQSRMLFEHWLRRNKVPDELTAHALATSKGSAVAA
ncbi:hypothetical protein [Streptomyces sp. NPDC059874]|uniref:hypothetical protein n=1 Tax=Streptomyces sp. NPDC059874 TaxID=3346983 RepID=UPI00365DD68B